MPNRAVSAPHGANYTTGPFTRGGPPSSVALGASLIPWSGVPHDPEREAAERGAAVRPLSAPAKPPGLLQFANFGATLCGSGQ
jgi:hypothetical protein